MEKPIQLEKGVRGLIGVELSDDQHSYPPYLLTFLLQGQFVTGGDFSLASLVRPRVSEIRAVSRVLLAGEIGTADAHRRSNGLTVANEPLQPDGREGFATNEASVHAVGLQIMGMDAGARTATHKGVALGGGGKKPKSIIIF